MAKRNNTIRPRGYPDRRGMGAQSDFIAEKFVPSERYKTDQLAMAEKLLASGMAPAEIARLFSVPCELLSAEKSS